jgi:hypothetical protein
LTVFSDRNDAHFGMRRLQELDQLDRDAIREANVQQRQIRMMSAQSSH